MLSAACRQVPRPGILTLDHLAHFAPDVDAASAALERLGFTLTPFSEQSHRLRKDGPLVSAGTGNRCIMLERGYLELLTPTGATPNADQLRAAMSRYVGVHVVVFGTAAAQADHARLAGAGFEPLTPIALQRPISTPAGEATARFTVVRVPAGTMAEGRIQYCHHHTPELLWQERWITHANGATALAAAILCVEDPEEAAARYGRFSGLAWSTEGKARHLQTDRGTLVFVDRETAERALGARAPTMPWIAGYVLESRNGGAARAAALDAGAPIHDLAEGRFGVVLPDALGGVIVFQPPESGALRLG
jgi:hypothetical protein